MKRYFFTDGSCKGNPGPGGYGIVEILSNKHPLDLQPGDLYYIGVTGKGYFSKTTNNRMEMLAILNVLRIAYAHPEDKFIIYTDSAYCAGMVNTWIQNWACNDWKTSKGVDVKNKDLVLKIWEYIENPFFSNVTIVRIKGHDNILGNELADRLATNSMEEFDELLEKYRSK